MKNLDLVDWTIRQAQLLNGGDGSQGTVRNEPSVKVFSTERADEGSVVASRVQWPEATDFPAAHDAPLSALLAAVVRPGIDTSPVDRDRAIALRWVLRDIKNARLKWWPVERHDLQLLIGLGLVEMRDDKPMLTNAGADVVV